MVAAKKVGKAPKSQYLFCPFWATVENLADSVEEDSPPHSTTSLCDRPLIKTEIFQLK